jgi:hypothetical protein
MKLLVIKDAVERLLLTSALCREDDNRLIVSIWAHQLGDDKVNEMSAIDLLNMISEGKLPNPESIRRIRQKLQELYPKLRGKNYKNRLEEQAKVKEELKQI